MREHRGRLQKPKVYLSFDVERDYVKSGYVQPTSFEGITHYVPRILDKLRELRATGTFFVTPEVIEHCEELVSELKKTQLVGLHSHAYYQPEFKGWKTNGDSFSTYTAAERRQMIGRDAALFQERIGPLKFFRIGRLEPNHTVLKMISQLGCTYDSSYHVDNYHLLEKLRRAVSYRFAEIPVTAHLFGLESHHFDVERPVVLIHPITPPSKTDEEVFDEAHLMKLLDACSDVHEFKGFDDFA